MSTTQDTSDIYGFRSIVGASLRFALGETHSSDWPSHWDSPKSLSILRAAFGQDDFVPFAIIVAAAAVLDPFPDRIAFGLLFVPKVRDLRNSGGWNRCETVVHSAEGQELVSSILNGDRNPVIKSSLGEWLADFGLELLESELH
jgi:hypothetical protein